MSYQILIIQGNLTKDCELRNVGESTVGKFSVAVNGYRDGEVEYFDCEHWNGGRVSDYLTKGTNVLVEGRIQTDSWTKDGEKRSRKVVKVSRLQLLGGKSRRSADSEIDEAMAAFDR